MITAAFTDGKALICVMPSEQGGVYLVRAEPQGMRLIITHDCPDMRQGKPCEHAASAEKAYYAAQWWEPKKETVLVRGRIVLQPDWRQVKIAAGHKERLRSVMQGAS